MPRPRRTLAELELTGYAQKMTPSERAAREAQERVTLVDRSDEIAKLTALIEQELAAAAQGSVVGNKLKGNPAFRNIESLIRARALLLKNHRVAEKTGEQVLAEADAFMRSITGDQRAS